LMTKIPSIIFTLVLPNLLYNNLQGGNDYNEKGLGEWTVVCGRK